MQHARALVASYPSAVDMMAICGLLAEHSRLDPHTGKPCSQDLGPQRFCLHCTTCLPCCSWPLNAPHAPESNSRAFNRAVPLFDGHACPGVTGLAEQRLRRDAPGLNLTSVAPASPHRSMAMQRLPTHSTPASLLSQASLTACHRMQCDFVTDSWAFPQ